MGSETKTSVRSGSLGKVVSKATKLVSDPQATKTVAASKRSAAAATTSTVTAPRKRSASKIGTQPAVTGEDRMRFIEMAAYYIAEKRGFSGGNPAEDWLLAEQQVDQQLLAG